MYDLIAYLLSGFHELTIVTGLPLPHNCQHLAPEPEIKRLRSTLLRSQQRDSNPSPHPSRSPTRTHNDIGTGLLSVVGPTFDILPIAFN